MRVVTHQPITMDDIFASIRNGDRASDMIVQFKWVDELVTSDFLLA